MPIGDVHHSTDCRHPPIEQLLGRVHRLTDSFGKHPHLVEGAPIWMASSPWTLFMSLSFSLEECVRKPLFA